MKYIVLGCGSATPVGPRISSAFLLKNNSEYFLIDCGEGAQMRLKPSGVKMQRISRAFISHLHGDHYFGLIGLISSFHLFGRTEPFHVYAQAPLKEIIDLQLEVGNTQLSYPLYFHEVNPNETAVIFENDVIKVTSFPLIHSVPTTGFRFDEKNNSRNINKNFVKKYKPSLDWIQKIKAGEDFVDENGNVFKNEDITSRTAKEKSFAYCSDTLYTETILPYIKDVDLLYHEATFMEDMKQAAIDKFHATACEAASIAKLAHAKQLMIGHYSARYKNIHQMVNEARSIFENTIAAEEGLEVEI